MEDVPIEEMARQAASRDIRPAPPVPQSHHRNVQGGVARAAVFGASDGLVSNVGLILGVAGASASSDAVLAAGVAGLIAGAASMAAGEFVSMRAQQELFERELELEREQIEQNPNKEAVELSLIYQSRGVDPDTAERIAAELMADPERALEAHAREELGIDPSSLGSPYGAAAGSFAAFSIGALVPLIPWIVGGGDAAVVASLLLAIVAATGLGLAIASFTGKSKFKAVGRQVGVAVVAALFTFAVGSLLGERLDL